MDAPAAYYANRRERLRSRLTAEGVDGVLLTHPVNVTYLTGFSGDSSYLVLGRQDTLLLSDGRYTEQLREECPELATHIRPPAQALMLAAGEVLTKLGWRKLVCEAQHVTLADFEALKEQTKTSQWQPVLGWVESLRQTKDSWELAQIREAIRKAEKAFGIFRAMLRGGDTEKELHDAMEGYVRRVGGRCSAFPPIVAAGPRAALPHAPPSNRRIEDDTMLLVDWGAYDRFYLSDLTRVLLPRKTASSTGSSSHRAFDAKLVEIYRLVRKAQQAAIERLRPGAKAGDVDGAARQTIADGGYGDYFTHSIGHGIGLQIHEAPFMRSGSDLELQAGMVVTIEPGIYIPGWGGIRIEDDVYLTPDGPEVLTHVPRELEEQWVEL